MTKKQINRFGRTDEKYYCSACISENLPFCTITNSKLNSLNCSDNCTSDKKVSNTRGNTDLFNCNLCMECNPQCTGCLDNACRDPQKVCSICCNCNYVELDQFNQKCSNFKNGY